MHTVEAMEITFDPAKNERNQLIRRLDFEDVARLDWDSALVVEDTRKDYSEPRYELIGLIDERAHVVVFTPTISGIRVISFRKANSREVKRYEQATQS